MCCRKYRRGSLLAGIEKIGGCSSFLTSGTASYGPPESAKASAPDKQVAMKRMVRIIFWQNDEHVHHYQRERASITGLKVEIRKIIETERLVVVARCGLFDVLFTWV
jgi:hypothetical protein